MARASKEEQNLFERLRAAHERNLITVYTDFTKLNTPRSPVFNPWEAVGPLLALLMFSLFILLMGGLIAGTVAMVLSVLLFAVGIRPWIEHQIRHRTVVWLVRDVKTLQTLWAFGGVGISLADQPQTVCAAPEGNWRNFVRRYLPEGDRGVLDEELAGTRFNPDDRAPDPRQGGPASEFDDTPQERD